MTILTNGPGKLTRKELAHIALRESGIYEVAVFEKFWDKYQEFLVQKLMQETEYLAQVIEEERKQRACERTQQRAQQIKLAGLFVLSCSLGMFLTLLLRL